jgi:transcriptional regulator with GAF, ATPase, and Fis domain
MFWNATYDVLWSYGAAMTLDPKTIDLTRDLDSTAQEGPTKSEVDGLLREALETLGAYVEYDLATVMQLRDGELSVRVACGRLANDAVEFHSLRLAKFPGLRMLLNTERARAFTEADHLHGDGDVFDGALSLPPGHSCMVVPLRVQGRSLGIMTFDREICGTYAESVVDLATVFGQLLGLAVGYGEQSARLARLGSQLQEQNRLLGNRIEGTSDASTLLEANDSAAMVRVVRQANQVASTAAPVLITGETGTGKEVLANAIHGWSKRSDQPIVGINCAALPANLIESELFGHVKGAFSGATKARMGRFQAANGGTLFLDEIGELPLDLQPKFLRALQEGRFEPVGSDRTVRVDVRILAATNQDLLSAMANGKFRDDLYYRIAVFPIHVPPLRSRREDIVGIAETFLDSLSRRTGRGPWWLSDRSKEWLQAQPWRGNVRELVNTLERATIVNRGPELEFDGDGDGVREVAGKTARDGFDTESKEELTTLVAVERRHIQKVLRHTAGKLYGQEGAAAILGLNPSTLRSRMKKLGLGGAKRHRN